MKSREEDGSILFHEIRHSLNKEVQLLDVTTRSKLTQARFNAIDHALPVQPHVFNRHWNKLPWGMAVAFAAMFTVLIVAKLTPLELNDLKLASGEKPVTEELFDEESDDALEMYEWLYRQYG